MSLFGESPPHDSPAIQSRAHGLFDDEPASKMSNSLFADDDVSGSGTSPWDMPTPRKQKPRAELVRSLLPPSAVPDEYIDLFDTALKQHGGSGDKIGVQGLTSVFAAARISSEQQANITAIVAPPGDGNIAVGRNGFNVLLALIGLAQEGETVSLDGVDERRKSKHICCSKVSVHRMARPPPLSCNAAKLQSFEAASCGPVDGPRHQLHPHRLISSTEVPLACLGLPAISVGV
jgi:sorting nexin-8